MLLEIILYVSLGFFAAVMLGLAVAPTIWNRAVVLTKQKVENSLPLNLNEIQAEKDKLRAEFAMTSRRLELGIEELREKASEQLIELHSKRDHANKLNQENKENLLKIENLETAAMTMRSSIEQSQERIDQLSDQLQHTSEDLSQLRGQHTELQLKQSHTEEELNKGKINLVASEGRVESLSGALSTLNLTDEEQVAKIKKLHDQITQMKLDLKEEKQNSRTAVSEAKAVSKKLVSTEKKLERLSSTDAGTKGTAAKLKQRVSELTSELIAENAKVVDLEVKLAQLMLRSETSQTAALEETTKTSSASALTDDLEKARKAVSDEIKQIAKSSKSKPEARKAARGKLKDLAAKTAAAVAANEGDGSPIAELVQKETSEDTGGLNPSLAKKISQLQATKS
ncbi:MAG: hypothetical protein AAF478_05020 [Pseudomonadota bacterium]